MLLRHCIIVAVIFPLFVGCDEPSSDKSVAVRRQRSPKKSGPLPPSLSAAERAKKSQSKGSQSKGTPVKKTTVREQPIERPKSTSIARKPDELDTGETLVQPIPDPPTVVQPLPSGDDPTQEFLAEVTPAVREARLDDATNFLCAVCLGHREPTTVQQYLRWSPALGRPVMSITWGLGVRVKYPKGNGKGVPDVRWRLTGDVRALSGRIPQVPLAEAWSYFTGELGDKLRNELIARINAGDFGQAYAVASKASSGRQFRPTSGRYPGLMRLGQGGPSSANNSRVDLVLTISVSATSAGTGWYSDIKGTPTLRDVRGGGSLKKWKTISTGDISRARKKGGSGGNLLDEYIAEFGKYIDENLAVGDFPTQDQKVIRARCLKLAQRPKHKDSLIELAELQYYHGKGQINDAQKVYVFKKILGDDRGKRLASGTQEQKIAVLQQLLPRVRAAK